ncbi:MAG TPA: glycosyltransferase family 4 protein [Candidatus Tectomicrobia bacterium]|nr:glycosyltransferase family 4 protein [Candidatus Tectomicrobia bacterium]
MRNHTVRILHIQKVAGIAGSENHLLSLLPCLQEYGFEPTMLVLADRNDRPGPFLERMRAAGITTILMPIMGDVDPLLLPRLGRFIRQGDYDIVHTHLFHADLYGGLAARLTGVRLVISTRHNDDAFRRRYLLRGLIAWSARYCDQIICISENVRRFCETTEGIPREKMTVVHYGLAPVAISGNRGWRCDFGWGDDVPVVGIVARLIAQKGHTTLLRAMPEVVQQFCTAQLVVVGDGELRRELQGCAQQLGIEPHVQFLGYRDNAAAMMPGFDVFVHPSRWEGFGLVFLEAMAASLPIIATQQGSIPEIVQHGETGLLVPVDDVRALAHAVCILLADRHLAQNMGWVGRRRLEEHFTLAAMVERTCAVYARLLSEKRSLVRAVRKSNVQTPLA